MVYILHKYISLRLKYLHGVNMQIQGQILQEMLRNTQHDYFRKQRVKLKISDDRNLSYGM